MSDKFNKVCANRPVWLLWLIFVAGMAVDSTLVLIFGEEVGDVITATIYVIVVVGFLEWHVLEWLLRR